jgi:predicted outer membrane protein
LSLFVCFRACSRRRVTDAQIAAIVVTANQVDIDAGKLAESSGSNAQIKAFGKQMVTDHTNLNKQATDLVTKLKVTPQDNPTAQSLKTGGAENVKKLSALKGAAFDRAYIDHEIAYHQQVLDALAKTLIPGGPCTRTDEGCVPGGARKTTTRPVRPVKMLVSVAPLQTPSCADGTPTTQTSIPVP